MRYEPGYVPNEEELRQWLLDQSDRLIPHLPERLISAGKVDQIRPEHWARTGYIAKSHGYAANHQGFRQLATKLTQRLPIHHKDRPTIWGKTYLEEP